MKITTLFTAAVALLAGSVSAYYQGACVKMPSSGKIKGMQYYMRIPDGKYYSDSFEDFPGENMFYTLKGRGYSCGVHNFTCIYDIDGNAHVDFIIKSKSAFNPTVCKVTDRIEEACDYKFRPNCVEGGPDVLSEQWKKSWRPN